MEFISKYKDIAEFVYYLSGPLMLLGVVVGIYHIKHLKRDISIRISRESTLLSVSVMEKKFNELSDFIDAAFNDDKYPDRPYFEGEVTGFHRATINCTNDFIKDMESGDHIKFENSISSCLCCLETLAQYINSGICDEERCYKLEGPLFVSYVEYFRAFIALDRKDADDHLYENIVSLYKLWTARLEHDNLLKKSNEINNKLKNIQKPNSLKIIGH